ncbi:MAG: hypothetical protein ACHQQR_06790, partial [Gemmatimonadales bacterium]
MNARAHWAMLALVIASGGAVTPALAQDVLLPSTSWGFVPVISGWHFNTPVPQSTGTGAIADVAQVAVPFRVRFGLGGTWSMDFTGAYATSAVHLAKPDSTSGGGDKVLLLSGPTDLKIRVTGPISGDALQMTFGLNLPTGTTKLSSDQTSVLEAAGAPALHMPVAMYGSGLGGTVGIVSAIERGDWAFAFGAAVEQRTEYTPIAIALASGTSNTQVTPGTAVHLSIGSDKTVGEGRLGLLLLGDMFTKDQVSVGSGGVTSGSTSYTLGPQVTALAKFDFGASLWRESGANIAVRYRSAYTDATGAKVPGSDATYVEGSIGGVLGHAGSTGMILSADARWHSGMTFTDALVGAAVTAAGVTIGYETSGGGYRFAIHPEYGSFSTGTTKT